MPIDWYADTRSDDAVGEYELHGLNSDADLSGHTKTWWHVVWQRTWRYFWICWTLQARI